MRYPVVSAVLTASALSLPAFAGLSLEVLVDFDDQMGGLPPVETDGMFNEHVTFSTGASDLLMIFEGAGFVGGSSPNILTAGESLLTDNFDGDIYMDFAVAANNVSLDVVADNDSGNIATLMIAHSGGVDFVDVIGNGQLFDPVHMDLSAFIDITSIELSDITDEFGLGIDNLAFTVPVPAPSGLAMLGLAGLAAGRRRR